MRQQGMTYQSIAKQNLANRIEGIDIVYLDPALWSRTLDIIKTELRRDLITIKPSSNHPKDEFKFCGITYKKLS